MPIYSYFDNLEPDDPDAEIWRFMPFKFFEDLMATDGFHLTRSDLFPQDEQEGIPPENYIRHVMGRRRYDPGEETRLKHHLGLLAQNREWVYVFLLQLVRRW